MDFDYFFLVIIVSTIWVYADARSKGIGKSASVKDLPYNLPPFAWAFLTFLVWFIGLPIYLFMRGALIRRAKADLDYAGDNTNETFGSAAGRSVSALVGAFLIMCGAALAMFGFDLIDQSSGQAGGGFVMIIGFALILPGLPIALTGVSMVISAKKSQSTKKNDTTPTELD